LTEWQLTNSISVPSLINTSSSANPTDGDSGISGIAGQSSQNSSNNSNSGSVAGGSGFQQSSGIGPGAGLVNPGKGNEALGGWTVSWCKEKWWGSVLAVSSGHSGIIKVSSSLYQYANEVKTDTLSMFILRSSRFHPPHHRLSSSSHLPRTTPLTLNSPPRNITRSAHRLSLRYPGPPPVGGVIT
jgi:hypothetical protein